MPNSDKTNHIEFTGEVFFQAEKEIKSNPNTKDRYIGLSGIKKLLENETPDFPVSKIWSTHLLAYEIMEKKYDVPKQYRLLEIEIDRNAKKKLDDYVNCFNKTVDEKVQQEINEIEKPLTDLEKELELQNGKLVNVMKSIALKDSADDTRDRIYREHFETYFVDYICGTSSAAKKELLELLDRFSYNDCVKELVFRLHSIMFSCEATRDSKGCYLAPLKKRYREIKKVEEWLIHFCEEVIKLLDLEVPSREADKSLYLYWRTVEKAIIAKWGMDSHIVECIKKEGWSVDSFDTQSLKTTSLTNVWEKLEDAKKRDLKRVEKEERKKQKEAIKLQKQKEKEQLRAEKQAQREKERAERLILAEEKQAQKGAVAEPKKQKAEKTRTEKKGEDEKGIILVPILNRQVPKSRFIMIAAGIPAIIAVAVTVPILMLNKKTPETAAIASVHEPKDAMIGTKESLPLVTESGRGGGYIPRTEHAPVWTKTPSNELPDTGIAETNEVVVSTPTVNPKGAGGTSSTYSLNYGGKPTSEKVYNPPPVPLPQPEPTPAPPPQLVEYTSNFLGVTVEASQSPAGVRVSDAPHHGQAHSRHGIRTGDIITEINGVKVNNVQDFKNTFENFLERDGYLAIIVYRGNSSRVIRIYK